MKEILNTVDRKGIQSSSEMSSVWVHWSNSMYKVAGALSCLSWTQNIDHETNDNGSKPIQSENLWSKA